MNQLSLDRPRVTAAEVVRLLEKKHSKDVFVSECKDGPTQFGSHLRLDGWAMPRSWAHPETVGYEIKVSRSDFLQDDKWVGYLDLCHKLYFVAPKGVIERDEVDPRCGLIEVSKNAKRLFTRKKAPTREVDVPESLFRYILMCRASIGSESRKVDRVQKWRDWLKERDENYGVGWDVSRVIAKKVSEQVDQVQTENKRLRRENAAFAVVREVMEEAGITGVGEFQARRAAANAMTSANLIKSLTAARDQTDKAIAALTPTAPAPSGTRGAHE